MGLPGEHSSIELEHLGRAIVDHAAGTLAGVAWVHLAASNLRQTIAARGLCVLVVSRFMLDAPPIVVQRSWSGVADEPWRAAADAYTTDMRRDPYTRAVIDRAKDLAGTTHGVLTLQLHDEFDDQSWSSQPFVQTYLAPLKIGACATSLCALSGKCNFLIVNFFRSLGDPPFSSQQLGLLHAVMRDLAPRIAPALDRELGWAPKPEDAARTLAQQKLSPSQLAVLNLLLLGHTEDSIAKKIHRSKHTVHTHAKAIYRLYKVRTRAQLLAIFVGTTEVNGHASVAP